MAPVTISLLRLTITLFLLFASGRLSTASLMLTQYEFVEESNKEFPVEGVATISIGGSFPRHFAFNCRSTINDGSALTWGRVDKVSTISPVLITGGVQLDLEGAEEEDLGVYVCVDSKSSDEVFLSVTIENPIASAADDDGVIYAVVGEKVVIKFYAAGLPTPSPSQITWLYNDSSNHLFTSGNFSDDNKSLTIPHVQLSDAGVYKIRVLFTFSLTKFSEAFAMTNLSVIVPPSIVTQPASVTTDEWNQVNITCIIAGTPPLIIEWLREDGASLPSAITSTVTIMEANLVQATLTFNEAHVTDEGYYFCNASLQNYPTYYSSSQHAQLIVKAKIQFESILNGGSAQQISTLLFANGSSPVTVDCLGSGNLWWTSSTGANISLTPSENPNQQTIGPLRHTLSFQSWSDELNGIYTCSSDLDGASDSITITNSNPVVVAEEDNVRVALGQEAVLRVSVAGSPQPGANEIQWYKNGEMIIASSPYTFTSDMLSLMFAVTDKSVAGTYECRVMTSEGTSSSFINVTFPDPPVVVVFPPSDNVMIGSFSSFTCNVTSSLDYELSWKFNGDSQLPTGVEDKDTVLVIQSAQPSHSGIYTCQAVDDINSGSFSATLFVNYSPTVMIGLTEEDKQFNYTHLTNEGDTPPSFSCFYNGYPSPNVTWTVAGGGPLPSGVKQTHAKSGILQLQFTSPLAYDDPVSFICTANNPLGTTQAALELTIRALPIVYSIVPTFPVSLNTSSPLSFTIPLSNGSSALTCLARGWPTPKIEWVDNNNIPLTNSYQECDSGVVSAVLWWRDDLDQGPVHCMAMNKFGEDTKTMQLYIGEVTTTILLSSPSETDGSTMVSFTLRVLTSDCHQWNEMTKESNEKQLESILTYSISSSKSPCRISSSFSIIITRSFCSSEVDGAAIFSGTISTSDADQTQQVYAALRDWYQSDPVLFLNGMPYVLDLECNLLVPADSQSECQIDIPSASPIPSIAPPRHDQVILIITSIATAMGICLVIIIVVIIIMCVWTYQKPRESHKFSDNWYSERPMPNGSWKPSNESIDFSGETSLTNYMENSPEYDMPAQVRESLRQMKFQDESGSVHKTYPRQLQTTSLDEVDAPSPQGINAPFQVSLSSVRHQHPHHPPSFMSFSHDGVRRQGMLSSQIELPIEEQLYQPLASTVTDRDKDHEYAQISQQPSQEYAEIPERVTHSVQGRRATISCQYPTKQPIKSSSTLPCQVNLTTSIPDARISPNHGHTGSSTPTLNRFQSQSQYTQPHSQASVFVPPNVQPYQLPVSSQHSLTHVALENPVHETVTSAQGASSEVCKFSLQTNHLKPNHIKPVDEMSEASFPQSVHSTDEPESQPWYKGTETDSIPPTIQQHEISPYAVTQNSEIRPSPYQEPCGSQGSLRTLQTSGLMKTVQV